MLSTRRVKRGYGQSRWRWWAWRMTTKSNRDIAWHGRRCGRVILRKRSSDWPRAYGMCLNQQNRCGYEISNLPVLKGLVVISPIVKLDKCFNEIRHFRTATQLVPGRAQDTQAMPWSTCLGPLRSAQIITDLGQRRLRSSHEWKLR
jgi:hypothetical protein